MSQSFSATRRRLSLLTSSSLVAASLMASAGGVALVAVAPTVALASDECGLTAGPAPDVLICSDAVPYVSGITYTTTTDGSLALLLKDGLTTVNAGIRLVGNAGEALTVSTLRIFADTGDIDIHSVSARGISLQSPDSNLIIDLTDLDSGDLGGPMVVAARTEGVYAFTQLGGDIDIILTNGTVTSDLRQAVVALADTGDVNLQLGAAGLSSDLVGVQATTHGAGTIDLTMTGGSITSSTRYAVSLGTDSGAINVNLVSDLTGAGGVNALTNGVLDVTTSGVIIANGPAGPLEGIGIRATGGPAGTTVTATGDITAAGTGILAEGGVGGVTVTAGNITANGDFGIEARAGNGGNVEVDTTGDVSGGTGIMASAITVGTVDVATGGAVTGTAGNGVTASGVSGTVDVNTTAGLVTSSAIGVQATSLNGDITVTAGDISATTFGISAQSTNLGGVDVTVGGVVEGDGGVIVGAASGDVTVTVLAGGSVEALDPSLRWGIQVDAIQGGDIDITVDGDVLAGGVSAITNLNGTVLIDGAGLISDTAGFQGVFAQTTDGDLTVNFNGVVTAVGQGLDLNTTNGDVLGTVGADISSVNGDAVNVNVTGTGLVNMSFSGTIDGGGGPGDDGISITTNTGNITLLTTGAVTGDPGVVLNSAGGVILYDANNDVTGDAGGITASNTTGSTTINVNLFGTVIEGDNDSNNTGAGVQVTSTTGAITVTSDADTSIIGAVGVGVSNTGAGAITLNLAGSVTGDGNAGTPDGIRATSTGAATIDITTAAVTGGVNSIFATGNNTIDIDTTGGLVTGSVAAAGTGIYANTTSGAVTIDTASVMSAGGVYGQTGAGAVSIDTTLGTVTAASAGGITGITGNASAVDIDVAVVSAGGVGVTANSAGGLITVNNSGAVSGSSGIVTTNTLAGVTTIVTTGGAVIGNTLDGINATGATGAIGITTANVTGHATGHGIIATTTSGSITINSTAGTVQSTDAAGLGGIDAVSTSGVIDIDTGAVSGAANSTGIYAQTSAAINIDTFGVVSAGWHGIYASGGAGAITINTGAAVNSTVLASAGLGILAEGAGVVTIDTGGTVAGQGGGVRGSSTTGNVTVDTTSGAVTTVNGSGVRGISGGAGFVNIDTAAVTSTNGSGITGFSSGGAITVDNSGIVSGGLFGISTGNSLTGTTTINTAAAVSGTANAGISAVTTGSGLITVDTGGTVGGAQGVVATSGAGGIILDTTSGTVTTTGGVGVSGVTSGAAAVNIDVAAVTAVGGVGVNASSAGGLITVDNSGLVSGTSGITTSNSLTGVTTITTVGGVTGTAGNGIHAVTTGTGLITIISGGVVTSSQTGIRATTDADVTMNVNADVNSSSTGLYVTDALNSYAGVVDVTVATGVTVTAGSGFYNTYLMGSDVTFDMNGTIVGGGGVEINSSGAANVDIDGNVTTAEYNGVGIFTGGNVDFDQSVGAITSTAPGYYGVDINSGGSVTFDTAAGTSISGDAAAVRIVAAGDVSGTAGGDYTSANGDAVHIDATGTATVNMTFDGALDGGPGAGDDGLDVSAGTGSVTLVTNGVVTGGDAGIRADSAGDVSVTANGNIFAGSMGIGAASTAGSSSVTVGTGVTIDPDDYGVYNFAAADATVTTLAGVTIDVNNTDPDFVAIGIYNESTALADGLDASVEVIVGANNTITVDDGAGGAADSAVGILAINSGGGTGSVEINVANGVSITAVGDGAGGIVGSGMDLLGVGAGDVTITVGTGSVSALAGADDVDDSGGLLPGNVGILAASAGGSVAITSGANVQANTFAAGGLESAGIAALTEGLGNVTVTTTVGSNTVGGDFGIIVNGEAGLVTVTTNAAVQGVAQDGIGAESTTGNVTITNNSTVNGGTFGVGVETGSGLVDINVNGAVTASAGNGVDVLATLAGGAVDVDTAVGATVTGTGGYGIMTQVVDGLTSITTNGAVVGDLGGIRSVATGGGTIDIETNSTVNSSAGTGVFGQTSGIVDLDINGNVTGNLAGVVGSSTGGGTVTIDIAAGTTSAGSLGAGVAGTTVTGDIDIKVNGNATGNVGVFANTGSGDIFIDTYGTVTGTGGGGIVATVNGGPGNVDIDVFSGNVTGNLNGILSTVLGAGSSDIQAMSSLSTIQGNNSNGISASTVGGANTVSTNGTVTGQTNGINATSSSGAVLVSTGYGVTSGVTGDGVNAQTGGIGDVQVLLFGDTSGVQGVDVNVTGTGFGSVTGNDAGQVVTGTNGDGIHLRTVSGLATVDVNNFAGSIVSTNGDGIDVVTSGGGAVQIDSIWAIDASEGNGIYGSTTGGGNVTIASSGNIGLSLDPVGGTGVLASVAGGAGVIDVTTSGNIFADAGGVGGFNWGTGGATTVRYNGGVPVALVGGSYGVVGASFDGGNASNVLVTVGADSTVTSGWDVAVGSYTYGAGSATATIGAGSNLTAPSTVGVNVFSIGGDAIASVGSGSSITAGISGISMYAGDDASLTLGDTVTIDPEDYGIDMTAGGDVTILAGTNLNIDVNNTDGDAISIGINAASTQTADVGAGDPTIDINVGNGLVIRVDDGSGGEADGSSGILAANTAVGTASIDIDLGSVDIIVRGDNSNGVLATATGGDVSVTVGSGIVWIYAGDDAADGANNFTYQTGIGAVSGGGNVDITSSAYVYSEDETGAADSLGLNATTTGLGTATIVSNNQVEAYGIGINASTVSGNVNIDSNGYVYAYGTDGISAVSTSGAIIVDQAAGQYVYAYNDGIYASSASAGNVQVTNASQILADATASGGYGISAINNGAGDTIVVNSGFIEGFADRGISALNGGTGNTSVNNTGAIGTSGNSIDDIGIDARKTAVGAGSVTVTANAAAGTYAVNRGIRATTVGTGLVQVDTFTANTITTTALTSIGIEAASTTGSSTVNDRSAISSGGIGISNTTTAGFNDTQLFSGGTVSSVDDGLLITSTTGTIRIGSTGLIASSAEDGVQANSTSGSITVLSNASISGYENGVVTTTGVGGTTVITTQVAANVTGSTAAGFAGINASTTGNGLIDINVANGLSVSGTNGSGIRTSTNGGVVTLDLGTGGVGAPATTVTGLGAGADSWVLDLNNSGASTTTVNIASNTTVRSTGVATARYGDAAIRGIAAGGGSVVINNAGRLEGRVSFAGITGGVGNVQFFNTSTNSWHTTGASTFSAGADLLNNSGSIFTNAGGVATSWNFGAGADVFINSGTLVVGEPALAASALNIAGLETWTNSGQVIFGSSGSVSSDLAGNDAIFAPGTTFTGSGSSRLIMDANLGALTQANCTANTVADCLSLLDGSTAGSTLIKITDISPNVWGAYNPTGMVVVDVAGGGTTADTHFSLDPTSSYWRADLNSADGVLDKGLFFYDKTLNGLKQHVLVGLPDSEAFEFTVIGTAAQNAWYQTTGTWFERQADLRDQLGDVEGDGAGVWVKITGGYTERDLINSYDLFGKTYSFDTSYAQNTSALIGGVDFVSASSADSQWVVGGMIGYLNTDVNFKASNTVTKMDGLTIGLYGTYVARNFFVDAVVAGNFMDLVHQVPTLAAAPNNIFNSEVNTVGGQVEGGYTLALGENAFLEPLISLSYVKTSFDDIAVPGAVIAWDDQTSLRGSLGARLGVNHDFDTFAAKFSITARLWDEFEGDNTLVIHSAGMPLTLGDDFGGSFGEVTGTVNVFSNESAFSAFVNAGVKFKEDYQSTDASLGFRWRW